MKVTPDVLSELGELLRGTILHGSEQTSRTPKRRGFTPSAAIVDPSDARTTSELIEELSRVLFPVGIRPFLSGIRALSIAPIRNLSSVPFALLEPFGDGRQVVDLFSVNFLKTIADLERPRLATRSGFRRPLIIGNPRAGSDPDWIFPDLPGAENEARFAQEKFGGTLLSGDTATEEAFWSGSAGAELIYIAAHAMANPLGLLDESFIALAGGRLTAAEVQEARWPQRPLVVLSACQTAQGRALDAGIIGVARAFQLANASNTVMSLWSIDDTVTTFQMGHFVTHLASGLSPAESMRLAMLATRARHREPRFWAAFNIFGNHTADLPAGGASRSSYGRVAKPPAP